MTDDLDQDEVCDLLVTADDSDVDHVYATGTRAEMEATAEFLRREGNGYVSYTVQPRGEL